MASLKLTKVIDKEERKKLENVLKFMKAFNEDVVDFTSEWSYQMMMKAGLSTVTLCNVNLYILEGFDLASRDIGSFSDPYFKVTLGKTVVHNSARYQLDEPNPRFNECIELIATFPGADPLIIQTYDYDFLFGDDLIGTTIIDLDDRWFCPEWKSLEYKPIEYRELYHKSTSLAQGTILCWVDIFEKSESEKPCNALLDIAPE